MKPVEYGVDISLKAGAAIENLKPKTMNCTPYAFGGANGYDDLPTNPVLGQMFHSSIDDRYYRWGIDRDNDITASVSYRWAPVADVVSEFAFDELSSPTNGVGYYRYNVTANEASVRQAFEDISAIGAAFFDMSSLRTLNLNDFTTPYEIQVVNQQGYTVTQPQIQPYVVNNPYAPRVIRVKNPDNQNPTLYNDTIPVVTGDILLPKYRADNGSWTYEVVRRYQDGGTVNGDFNITEGSIFSYGKNGKRLETLTDANTGGIKSGFYEAVNPVNFPTGTVGVWWHLINSAHYNSYAGNNYNLQITGSFFDNRLFFRKTNAYNALPWRELLSADANGNVGIGAEALPSAKLQVDSTTQGVLLPRMTTTQINAISSPAEGLEVYNTTLHTKCFYNGSSWQKVTSSAM